MKLISKEIEQAFIEQGYTGDKNSTEIKIIVKLFNPMGTATWYLYEKEGDDIYWGFVNLDDPEMAECGTISMNELLEYRGTLGFGIERDINFEPGSITLNKVIKIIKEGGQV
jgi:hypothetical protein